MLNWLLNMFVTVSSWVTSRFEPGRPRATRAVSMLEYVLIAAVAIVLAGLFVPGVRGAFTNLFSNVTDFLGGSDSAPPPT